MMVVNYLARKTGVLQEADSGLCAPRTGEEKHSLLNSWSSMQLHCWYLFMGLQPHVSLHPPFVLYQVHSFKHIFNLSNNGRKVCLVSCCGAIVQLSPCSLLFNYSILFQVLAHVFLKKRFLIFIPSPSCFLQL